MTNARRKDLDEHVRLPQDVKSRLDGVARKRAEQLKKKNVPYYQVIAFLIDKYEESKKNEG